MYTTHPRRTRPAGRGTDRHGKDGSYLLPILSMLDDGGFPKDAINCVIMSPTRELAQQIDQAMQGFSYYMSEVNSVAVYGATTATATTRRLKE